MSIIRMEEMTWKEIERVNKIKSVIFLALSPIEEHGPTSRYGLYFRK